MSRKTRKSKIGARINTKAANFSGSGEVDHCENCIMQRLHTGRGGGESKEMKNISKVVFALSAITGLIAR